MAVLKWWDGAAWQDLNNIVQATVPIEAWHTVGAAGEPAFNPPWSSLASPYTVQFKKMPDGTVRIRGAASGGAQGSVIFTLPVGYRPSNNLVRATILSNGSVESWGDVRIFTDGTVVAQTASSTFYFVLDCSFVVDQLAVPAGSFSPIAVAAALPASPVHGQEVLLEVDKAAVYGGPFYWHCRYSNTYADGTARAAARWDVIAPQPLRAEVTTAEAKAANGTRTDLATVGPTIVVPAAGDYLLEWGMGAYYTSGAGAGELYMSLVFNGVEDTNYLCAAGATSAATLNTGLMTAFRKKARTAMAAATSVKPFYGSNNVGGGATFTSRYLNIYPIRLS
jgi:hypothetical protein